MSVFPVTAVILENLPCNIISFVVGSKYGGDESGVNDK